jgi:predicted kinase
MKSSQTVINPICWILVGLPGSGKSTWIIQQNFNWDTTVIASTDNFIESYALEKGKTYNEVYDEYMPSAVALMVNTVIDAVKAKKDIVWDQTSVSRWSRKKKLRMLSSDYTRIAVVFHTPDEIEHRRRLTSRLGKSIPEHVIASMKKNFVMPTTLSEGFDNIIEIN